jgi:hypothetical protein
VLALRAAGFLPSPSWVGDVQVAISIPGAGINESYLPGWVGLTDLPRGAWSTLRHSVPAAVQTALLGDYADARISILVNLGSCGQPTLFDNLRFAGDLHNRERFHLRGSDASGQHELYLQLRQSLRLELGGRAQQLQHASRGQRLARGGSGWLDAGTKPSFRDIAAG